MTGKPGKLLRGVPVSLRHGGVNGAAARGLASHATGLAAFEGAQRQPERLPAAAAGERKQRHAARHSCQHARPPDTADISPDRRWVRACRATVSSVSPWWLSPARSRRARQCCWPSPVVAPADEYASALHSFAEGTQRQRAAGTPAARAAACASRNVGADASDDSCAPSERGLAQTTCDIPPLASARLRRSRKLHLRPASPQCAPIASPQIPTRRDWRSRTAGCCRPARRPRSAWACRCSFPAETTSDAAHSICHKR